MSPGNQFALVHDYFVQDGGAERCAVELARMLPDATVFTSFFDASRFANLIDPARVRPWPLQRLVGPTERFRLFLPLYALWFSLLDFRDHSLVISSSSAFAKSVRGPRQGTHISYVYTPMRFAWNIDGYLAESGYPAPLKIGARLMAPLLRSWDRRTAGRPDVLVAISRVVQERIREAWGRDSEVIYPPVPVQEMPVIDRDDGYLLVAARMIGYRRLDIAIKACNLLGRDLIVVGDGPERARLEAIAGRSISFTGWIGRRQLIDLMSRCSAYLLPGEEDFGIAPVEAMACGRPVVAYAKGGATETVIDGVTGVLFRNPEAASMAEAIERLGDLDFDRNTIRRRAELFDVSRFHAAWFALFSRLGIDVRSNTAPL